MCPHEPRQCRHGDGAQHGFSSGIITSGIAISGIVSGVASDIATGAIHDGCYGRKRRARPECRAHESAFVHTVHG